MTLLENTLLAIGRLQGLRSTRKEEETFVVTDMLVDDSGIDRQYQLEWHTGNFVDVFCVYPPFQKAHRTCLGRVEILPFATSPIAQAIAFCGLIEADLHLRREE
jgi:hypothetical protein